MGCNFLIAFTATKYERRAEAIKLAKSSTSCLICCCPDWTLFRRICLVEAIAKSHALDFRHLQKTGSQPERRRKAA